MLRSLRKLSAFRLQAIDGDVGKPKNWLVDDSYWAVRYAVASRGIWPAQRRVLVAPGIFEMVDDGSSILFLNATRRGVEAHSIEHEGNHECRTWRVRHPFGFGRFQDHRPLGARRNLVEMPRSGMNVTALAHGISHICGWRGLSGCGVYADGHEIGRLWDLIAEDRSWTILYLVIRVGRWWSQEKLALVPDWIECVDWAKPLIRLNVPKQLIWDAPQFVPSLLSEPEYEQELLTMYYGQEA